MGTAVICDNYAVANSDAGQALALTGIMKTLTYGPASNYDADFSNLIVNQSESGQRLIVDGLPTEWLWPSQSATISNVNNQWAVQRQRRWSKAGEVRFYTNFATGDDDANDGLHADRPMKTANAALYRANDQLDWRGSHQSQTNAIVRMADNVEDTAGVHLALHDLPGAQGGAALQLEGGVGSVLSSPTGDALFLFGSTLIEIRKLKITAAGSGISLMFGAKAYVDDIEFGACGGGYFVLSGHGEHVEVWSTGIRMGGNAAGLVLAGGPSSFKVNATPFRVIDNITWSLAAAYVSGPAFVNFQGASMTIDDGKAVTGKRFLAGYNSVLFSGNGSRTFFPGSEDGETPLGGIYL